MNTFSRKVRNIFKASVLLTQGEIGNIPGVQPLYGSPRSPVFVILSLVSIVAVPVIIVLAIIMGISIYIKKRKKN
ncbi:hypothetical protein A3J20_01460 [Candidatus Gottesmanbacteria bacterium RIFCSPLOWO2_02_FULL_42_29]|uniref:Uncharacterized protein n=1 Tax=Candidatus Gottesmanbacteria bacterium RIFCSPLOWO2_01_FULL_42_22 TaxID=1798391 RepID=A0A1F6BEW7_9BACT|nr:MAG: hypothetical protein A2781_03440 [Candidatus Gottesmanbacteria bacterium RIFCSPHIGHO2_01_FULL_42_27]OGG20449.1 MAG: hypothetical protein A3E72_04755 [Candidatus Gottesmanbacteria bacterium RIFCSPHIGHO2_12_FULL_43_26]OGG34342.1 MAG: hypothetical protein A3G68_05785 [Candidatus Gottesmanbacteria bacterium RIFCSPLOWO2_12_FULL_42_10]OGG35481.1 MAG: hypothetical protein A2968_00795 [Candidatus Gottesmanbacteria bacterium RIFCSPLOWO2_01_FULL_42_22]OGG38751.1 MAG: hypothetical protein A3J20_01